MAIELSRDHVEAANRRRRVVVNFDAIVGDHETRKRGLEAFFSHQMNGGDDDFYADAEGKGDIPLKDRHPEWTLLTPWGAPGIGEGPGDGASPKVARCLTECRPPGLSNNPRGIPPCPSRKT